MPEDKVKCITRVSKIIMNLLSLAQDKSAPGADDFMPVLVFVSLGQICILINMPEFKFKFRIDSQVLNA